MYLLTMHNIKATCMICIIVEDVTKVVLARLKTTYVLVYFETIFIFIKAIEIIIN